jgi:iron complex outermembrane receptor protein
MLRRLLFLTASISILAAQDSRSGSISGKVLDPSGGVVPAATVRLYSRDSLVQRTTQTDGLGEWLLDRLPPGEYLAEARTDGLNQAKPVALKLEAGTNQKLDLTLEIEGLATRILVTASTTPQSLEETGKAMDVVDQAEIARREEFSFSEALRMTPALRVQQLGGPGSFTRIQTRGLRAADTAVLLDGMRLRDAAAVQGDATAYMGELMMIDTDRIEVLRGTGSSIYGTNAIGGAINLVSDQGGGRVRGEIGGEGGGLGVFRGIAKMAGGLKDDRVQYSAGLAHLNVNGGIDGVENVRNTAGQGYAQWRPLLSASLSGRVYGTVSTVGVNSTPFAAPVGNLPPAGFVPAIPLPRGQVQLADRGQPFDWGNATFAPNLYDPDGRREGDFLSTLVNWQQQIHPRVSYRVSYQGFQSNRDTRNGPSGSSFQPSFNSSSMFNSRIDTLQARTDVTAGRGHLLTAGYEYEREWYENMSRDENLDPGAKVDASTTAVQKSNTLFVQDQMPLLTDRLQLALSGRWQTFGLDRPTFEGGAPSYSGATLEAPRDALTGDAALSYFIPKTGTKLRAHGGNGYRSPSLYERFGASFYFGNFYPLGDPRLRPERTVAVDFGVDQYFANSRYRVSATYFYTRLQEVIGYGSTPDDPFGRFGGYVNVGGGLARGVETSLEARPWRSAMIRGSYTYTNADERTPFLVGGVLSAIRVFPHQFSLVGTQQITKRLQATVDYLAASDYISGTFFVVSGNRPYIFPGPRRLDAAASYTRPLGEKASVRFFVRCENILNQRYFEDGFRTPGAWATGGARFSF